MEKLWKIADVVSVDALLVTGVGKPVHKLLTSGDKGLKEMAARLVSKWKKLIVAKDKENAGPGRTTPETPRPNYEGMLSPALRKELRKFGLKVIPR